MMATRPVGSTNLHEDATLLAYCIHVPLSVTSDAPSEIVDWYVLVACAFAFQVNCRLKWHKYWLGFY